MKDTLQIGNLHHLPDKTYLQTVSIRRTLQLWPNKRLVKFRQIQEYLSGFVM